MSICEGRDRLGEVRPFILVAGATFAFLNCALRKFYMRLLYFSPYSHGGLADYTQVQADALGKEGAEVTILCRPTFAKERSGNFVALPRLREMEIPGGFFARKFAHFSGILEEMKQLDLAIREFNHDRALLSFSEYLAPLWSQRFQRHANQGVQFGAIVHDPVRDFVVGPEWWHRLSIRKAYSFLSHAFVHEHIELDTAGSTHQPTTTVIPHGIYSFPPSLKNSTEARESLDIPASATALLSFGHIRDGKNLDLILKSLQGLNDCYLIVAGKEQSSGQRPAQYYQEMARELGVDSRCRWIVKHVPESEVGDLFAATDLLMLTYSADFRSASGVLNTAVNFRVPCVASSGEGPLKSSVERYNLGAWARPDSQPDLEQAIRKAIDEPASPDWERYVEENSWKRNANIVISKMWPSANAGQP